MSNHAIERCIALAAEGYSISAVYIHLDGPGRMRVQISRNNYVPMGEGGDMPRHSVTVDTTDLPAGMRVFGFDRIEDDITWCAGNAEQAEAMIIELARIGQSQDWHRFGGESDARWLTKPNRWFSGPRKSAK